MELRSTRRIVTGHDAQGKAVALYDAPLQAIQRSAGGNGMTLCWVTGEFPVDLNALENVGVPALRLALPGPFSPRAGRGRTNASVTVHSSSRRGRPRAAPLAKGSGSRARRALWPDR